MSEIQSSDIFSILAGWTQADSGQSLSRGSALESFLLETASKSARELSHKTTLNLQLQRHGLSFQRLLQRSAVKAWKKLQQAPTFYSEAPIRCPACDELMLGKWECGLCGFEAQRWKLQAESRYSLDPMLHLPLGFVLLPDPRRRRLVFLDLSERPEVVWQVNLSEQVCKSPVSALLLPRQEILVADQMGSVLICNLFGQELWRSEYLFKAPVFADATRDGELILVADRDSHQALALNRKHEVIWTYGEVNTYGKEDNQLNQPHCVRLTAEGTYLIADTQNRRVIEVSALSRKIRRVFSDNKMETPIWCERLVNGHTVVLDSHDHRLLEFDHEGKLLDLCHYYQDSLDPRYRVRTPHFNFRRENGHYLLASPDRAVEISMLQKRLLWYSLLTDMRPPSTFQPPQPLEKQPKMRNTLSSTRLQTPFKLVESLQKVDVFAGAPEEFFNKLKLCLRLEECPAGHLLMREGQRGDTMYLLREGQLEIIKDFQVIYTLGPGEIVGEMALLNEEPRSATVRAKTACRLYRLNRLAFESVIQGFPEVYGKIKKLAEVRRSMQKPTIPEGSAKERLEKLMNSHRQRLQDMRERLKEPRHHTLIKGPIHWKLKYTQIEQHVIEEAQRQDYACHELHIRLSANCQMKSVRVALLVSCLEKHGEIIKTHPTPDNILKERLDDKVILTVLSQASRSRLIDEISAVSEIDEVQSVPVRF